MLEKDSQTSREKNSETRGQSLQASPLPQREKLVPRHKRGGLGGLCEVSFPIWSPDLRHKSVFFFFFLFVHSFGLCFSVWLAQFVLLWMSVDFSILWFWVLLLDDSLLGSDGLPYSFARSIGFIRVIGCWIQTYLRRFLVVFSSIFCFRWPTRVL